MFAKYGTQTPVGLFSLEHIISIIICFVLVALAVILTRKMTTKTYFNCLKVFSIILTLLELFKIGWIWNNGIKDVNAWVPLYFCSLFIYALWLIWFKNKFIKEMGLSYTAFGALVAGIVFIIAPTTSFNSYPIYHFQCLYSMLFHSIMVYSAIMLFVTKCVKIDLKLIFKYAIFCIILMTIAGIININTGSNLMFIADAGFIPIGLLHVIYDFSPILYSIVMILAHLSLGFVVCGVVKFVEFISRCKTLDKK